MRRTRIGWALWIGLSWIASTASAAEPTDRQASQDARWIPGASIFSMGIPEKREARGSSDTLDDADGNTTGFPWSVGTSAELASPVVLDVPGKPRLYVHGDVSYVLDTEDPVLSDGDPGTPPTIEGTVPTVQGITGVGQSIRVEAKPLLLSGGAGAIFSFEAFERTFRVRPSLEWMYRKDTIKTLLGSGENEGTDPVLCQPCRTLFIEAQTEKGYHSLGPGLELEVDAARAGDLLVSFFAAGRAYRILGDRKAEVVATESWRIGNWESEPIQPSSRAPTRFRAQYERDPWHYRFGFGLRFSWLPE